MRRDFMPRTPLLLALVAALSATGASAWAQQSEGGLRAAAQNPIANFISVPFQINTLFGVDPNDEVVIVLNIQPVIPFRLSEDINVITRTIAPLIYVPETVARLDVLPQGVSEGTSFGLGDINFTAFFSPAKPRKVIWGVGPTITLPTATDSLLGSEKLSLGPSAVVLVQPKPWTIGILARPLWSVAGSFGLLPGFGFASVLAEIGLPQTEVPTALLFFNIGVEAGQIVFVFALLGAFLFAGLVLRHLGGTAFLTGMSPCFIQRAAGYGVGVLASVWLIDRVTGFWT